MIAVGQEFFEFLKEVLGQQFWHLKLTFKTVFTCGAKKPSQKDLETDWEQKPFVKKGKNMEKNIPYKIYLEEQEMPKQ